jgi:hypothetical protein
VLAKFSHGDRGLSVLEKNMSVPEKKTPEPNGPLAQTKVVNYCQLLVVSRAEDTPARCLLFSSRWDRRLSKE